MNVQTLWQALTVDSITKDIMEVLLDTYPDLLNNRLSNSERLLGRAILKGHATLSSVLIKHPKVDINLCSDNNTPLTLSVKSNEPDLAIALLNAGAIIKRDCVTYNFLEEIKDETQRNKVKSLLESKEKEQNTIAVGSIDKKLTADQLAKLMESCRYNTKLLEIIALAHKDIINDELLGYTGLLFWAACKRYSIISRVLIDVGCNINRTSDKYGETALMCAIRYSSWDCVEQLIHAGADLEIKNKVDGKTALWYFKYSDPSSRQESISNLIQSKLLKLAEPKTEPTAPVDPKTEEPNAPVVSISLKLIKFMRENNLDYTFGGHQIITSSNDKLIEFALQNNIAFTETANKITISC